MAWPKSMDQESWDVTLMGHPEARNIHELWAGKTNVKERRRLQNRLNRRAFRKRQAEEKRRHHQRMAEAGLETRDGRRLHRLNLPGVSVFALAVEGKDTGREAMSLKSIISVTNRSDRGGNTMAPFGFIKRSDHVNTKLLQSWSRKFEKSLLDAGLIDDEVYEDDASSSDSDTHLFEELLLAEEDIRNGSPFPSPDEHLLNLTYYNVFRGLSKNIRALKLDLEEVAAWGCDSPFVTGSIDTSSLAPDFQPTYLQRTVSHHPCFDIFPDPVVRNNAIFYWYVEKHPLEERLCVALAGGRHTWQETELPERQGCILWGEPDMAESWEVTEGFVNNWPFLVKGAFRLEAATNRYRLLRGEPPMYFA